MMSPSGESADPALRVPLFPDDDRCAVIVFLGKFAIALRSSHMAFMTAKIAASGRPSSQAKYHIAVSFLSKRYRNCR